jgi:hypothetical protein
MKPEEKIKALVKHVKEVFSTGYGAGFNICMFAASTVLTGLRIMLVSAIIILASVCCIVVLLLLPGYLIIGCGYYIIGIIYTLFVWGIAWKIGE